MESSNSPQAALQTIEQGSVTAWTKYPPTPRHYYAVLGAAEGVLASMGPLGRIHPALAVLAAISAALAGGAVFGAYRKQRGQMPSRGMPAELRRPVVVAIALFLMGYGALVALSFTPLWYANPLLGACFAHVGGDLYERRYRAAADAAEQRVGLQ